MLLYHLLRARQEPAPTPVDPNKVHENEVKLIAVSVFTICLAMGSTALRFAARSKRKLKWEMDDYWMLGAALAISADAACYLAAIRFGFGHSMQTLQPEQLRGFFIIAFTTFLLYGVAVMAVKMSVLLFYRRTFPVENFKKWVWFYGALNIIWFLTITFVSVFQCKPVAKAWDDSLEGRCVNYLHLFLAIQAANIALDMAILMLPIRVVWNLQISRPKKIGLIGIFALGFLSVIFAIVRLWVLIRDQFQSDITYETDTALWSVVEPAFEIFCACLPCLIPFLKSAKLPGWVSTSMFSSLIKRSRSDQSYPYRSSKGYQSTGSGGTTKKTASTSVTSKSSNDDIPFATYASNQV
ncbi:hypothetical protein BDV95DRAFT_610930 [Massariosphaeria phaeospora]|uniref:Rhodopsin domain-containing protein n=1 Tax=Massariosphaeria phaeospora TaxID=100035 RepID=A0A7C8I2G3_9PLEO|nr:hypothetical protein BDV95DRAFT_610930 [Massariosphaeria phaeospora]